MEGRFSGPYREWPVYRIDGRPWGRTARQLRRERRRDVFFCAGIAITALVCFGVVALLTGCGRVAAHPPQGPYGTVNSISFGPTLPIACAVSPQGQLQSMYLLTATQGGFSPGFYIGAGNPCVWSAVVGSANPYGPFYAIGGGTAQAQVVSLTPPMTTTFNGIEICWLPAANNTGSAPTLAGGGSSTFGPNIIVKNPNGNTALLANDLATTTPACAIFQAGVWVLQNPQASLPAVQLMCSGQIALSTGAIASGARATNTLSCPGLSASTDMADCTFSGDTNAVTGYAPSAAGGLIIKTWVSSGTINADQVNNTANPVTPGAATLNCKGLR